MVNSLIDCPALSPDEEDYLDVLGPIIADYEDSIYEHPELSPVERLRHLMEDTRRQGCVWMADLR